MWFHSLSLAWKLILTPRNNWGNKLALNAAVIYLQIANMALPLPCLLAQEMSCGYVRRLWVPIIRSPTSPTSLTASLTIFSLAALYMRVQSFFLMEVLCIPAYHPLSILFSLNLAASSFSLLIFTCFLYMHQKYNHQGIVLFLNTAASSRISCCKQMKNLPHLHQLCSRSTAWKQSNAQHWDKTLAFEMAFFPTLNNQFFQFSLSTEKNVIVLRNPDIIKLNTGAEFIHY